MAYDGYFLDLADLLPGEGAFYSDGATTPPGWEVYRSPSEILHICDTAEVSGAVERASKHARDGGFSIGFLSYEAASGLNPAIETQTPTWPTLCWFALFDQPPLRYRELLPEYATVQALDIDSELDLESYAPLFSQVRETLGIGESYQVNLTFRQRFRLEATAHRFFACRCGVRPPRYASFIRGGEWDIASFSPELLYERKGTRIWTRPMKGTAKALGSGIENARLGEELRQDPKTIAENVMIVDMMRNDLGAFCETGSVQTPALMTVEKHGGLLQVTSTVTGRTEAADSLILRKLFPAASITGAPKVSTSQIIRRLEPSPRHVYCGAIGVMGQQSSRFAVGIRTALVHVNGEGEYGIGSGLVWDSTCEAEYLECLAKAEMLTASAPQWAIVEAFPGGGDIAPHVQRSQTTASRFGIEVDEEMICQGATNNAPKVRVELRLDGDCAVSMGRSAMPDGDLRAVLASRPVFSGDPNLRIKTNSRAVLDAHLDEHPEFDEVLIYNERGEFTEFCRGNLIVIIHGERFTPRPESGCLPGTAVGAMLQIGDVSYRDLFVGDIAEFEGMFFINSVVGMRRVLVV